MNAVTPKPRRGQLILLMLLFFVPLLFAFATYYGSNWRPGGHTNHGELIDPVRPLPAADFLRDRPNANHDLLIGKWTLAYISDGQCDDDCQRALYFMRQTQQSLGALMPRTQRIWLVTAHCCDPAADPSTDPPLIPVDTSGDAGSQWLGAFPADGRPGTLFVIDPHGNLMMRYDSKADPKGLREDLKKLLGLSHIG